MALFGKGVRRICAVVAASTAAEMTRQVRSALRETKTLELRLDWLQNDAERARFLRWLNRTDFRGATFLATCRRREGGGRFPGDIDRQLFWLIRAREAGCQWCDLEVDTMRKLPYQSIREYPVPPRVMFSVHDFERTPTLPANVNVPAYGEVDAVKIAANAQTIADSVRLLRLARRSRNFVAVPMGETGLPARILALREGSALAYASVAETTAPGQVSLQEMKYLYRAQELTRRTQVYGVIGDPIGHSLSPLLQNTGFSARRMDAVYLPFLVHRLGDFLAAVPEFGVRGFSVTLPHKQTILRHLKGCEPLAAEIGAVNTVIVRRDGSLYGCNTDYVGVLRALEKRLRLRESRVLIIGAGGAVAGEAVPRRALRSEFFDAILNCTPVGMHPHDGISPLASGELHCRTVMDLIYRPQRTRLLKIAARKGISTVSGVEMFLAQGVAQWEIWTEKRAPEAAMRRAVLAALRAEEKPHPR